MVWGIDFLGWWGQRWLEYAARGHLAPPSGKRLQGLLRAEADLRFSRGSIEARVPVGHYGRTVDARFTVRPISDRDWRRVIEAVAAQPEAAQRLLSGNPGSELEEIFAAQGLALFPPPRGAYPLRCTCVERLDCRHLLILALHTAILFDRDPFLWLEVLGHPRAELLAAVRTRVADASSSVSRGNTPEAELNPEHFWETPVDPDSIAVRPGEAAAPHALLRRLGPLPLPPELTRVVVLTSPPPEQGGKRPWGSWGKTPVGRPLEETLQQYVTHIAAAAAELAVGERAPAHQPARLPGKPVRQEARLLPEVVAAVQESDTALSLAALYRLCPTASAMPEPYARRALAQTLARLPAPLVGLAGMAAGRCETVLAGARFRHVVTFAEWRQQALSADADWVRALQLAGLSPPYQVAAAGQTGPVLAGGSDALFAALRPEVGDELQLAVEDPGSGQLSAILQRRAVRTYTHLADANADAAADLLRHMDEADLRRLAETEAVAVLLGNGRYRSAIGPDPVWLLPCLGYALYSLGEERLISNRATHWEPPLQGYRYGRWQKQGEAIGWLVADLARRGESKRRVEEAVACAEWWIRHWPWPQSEQEWVPPIGVLLAFLWNVAPRERYGHPAALARVPALLTDWFTVLTERYPAVRESYSDHIAACRLAAAYEHRLRTVPRDRGQPEALRAWLAEGYRWIGPEAYFTPVRRW